MTTLPYDESSPQSIAAYGLRLVGHSLRTTPGAAPFPRAKLNAKVSSNNRHGPGELVEQYYYDIHPSNAACSPDFQAAGVELKTSSLLVKKRVGVVPKERLVFGMIDYDRIGEEEFESSCFMSKNRLVMALWYIHEDGVPIGDLRFHHARLIRLDDLPDEDKAIIREDWEKIAERAREGHAELLGSEATPTTYLEALTKGGAGKRRRQSKTGILARPRAFAFKINYIKTLLSRPNPNAEHLFQGGSDVSRWGFEAAVLKRFEPFLRLTELEIATALGLRDDPGGKQFRSTIAKAMIGVTKTNTVAEFERANIEMKTIHHVNGKPQQHISFPAFRYMGPNSISEEVWDTEDGDDERLADIRRRLQETRYLFVVFKESQGVSILAQARFWSMPQRDIENHVHPAWERARLALETGDWALMPRIKDSHVCHIRTHANVNEPKLPTPHNGMQTKRSFWLDMRYVSNQLGLT
ncbi:hypothetical protein FIM08_00685 [SAR202 cluster bacterium AC-647-N09_OGT_505m]|nr:hypothetical protein [SAR202 cluster bacterium AC-647-N09_OGT_505m]